MPAAVASLTTSHLVINSGEMGSTSVFVLCIAKKSQKQSVAEFKVTVTASLSSALPETKYDSIHYEFPKEVQMLLIDSDPVKYESPAMAGAQF